MKSEPDIPVAVPVPVPAIPIPVPSTAPPTNDYYKNDTTHPTPLPVPSEHLNEFQIKQLESQGFAKGLIQAIHQTTQTYAMRYWVVDNSGSMAATDGHRLLSSADPSKVKLVTCTRWKEIQETIEYHSQMAALLQSPTTFRLLNNPGSGPQVFSIGDKGPDSIPSDLNIARNTMMNATPAGVTPLSQHIYHIYEQVAGQAPQLMAEGRKVAVILATDGLPTNDRGIAGNAENNKFVDALRSLEGLPIWVVIRLCTDDERIVDFYNNLDNQLELSLEVLDDFTGEAEEVYEHNPWLNYSLPIQRMREMGFHNRLFDLLDERKFTLGEVRDFCLLLFGHAQFHNVPDPEVDFRGFLDKISKLMKKEKNQWNPVKKRIMPIVNLEKLMKLYGDGSCVIM